MIEEHKSESQKVDIGSEGDGSKSTNQQPIYDYTLVLEKISSMGGVENMMQPPYSFVDEPGFEDHTGGVDLSNPKVSSDLFPINERKGKSFATHARIESLMSVEEVPFTIKFYNPAFVNDRLSRQEDSRNKYVGIDMSRTKEFMNHEDIYENVMDDKSGKYTRQTLSSLRFPVLLKKHRIYYTVSIEKQYDFKDRQMHMALKIGNNNRQTGKFDTLMTYKDDEIPVGVITKDQYVKMEAEIVEGVRRRDARIKSSQK